MFPNRRYLSPLIAFLGLAVSMAHAPMCASAQPGSRIVLRPEPGWPALQIFSPRDGARYTGASARAVPVDFRIHRGDLTPRGFRMAVTIDGRRYIATDNRSFPLENLSQGEHHIRFELLDYRGETVPGGTSVQERRFLVGPRPRPSSAAGYRASAHSVSIAPRTYDDPAVSVSPSARNPQGFVARPGGRREGPVPDLEAPEPRYGVQPDSQAASAREVRPASALPAEFVAPAAPEEPADSPSTSNSRSTSAPRDTQSTISATMRRTLEETGRRLTSPGRQSEPESQTVTVRSSTTTSTITTKDSSTSAPSEPDGQERSR